MVEQRGPRRAGMREVARAAGVSVSTVANVLSRPAIVAVETRLRVGQAIARVGSVRNGPARVLKGIPSTIVGSVILDLANPSTPRSIGASRIGWSRRGVLYWHAAPTCALLGRGSC